MFHGIYGMWACLADLTHRISNLDQNPLANFGCAIKKLGRKEPAKKDYV